MFEKPTVNDYLGQLRMQHEQAVSEFGKERLQIQSSASARGTLQSSMTILMIMEATEVATKKGVAAMLGELRRTIQKTDLDPNELRQLTIPRIEELASALISAGGWQNTSRWLPKGSAKQVIDDRLDKILEQVRFWIRQFDVGFDQAAEPEPIGVTNILNARDITGAVQQGSDRLSQSVNVQIDVSSARNAIEILQVEIARLEVPEATRAELQSDIATVQAQLSKVSPNGSILREAGRSLRNVAEGVLGGMLTPEAIAALGLLGRALGI